MLRFNTFVSIRLFMTKEKGCNSPENKDIDKPEEKVVTTGSSGVHNPTYGTNQRRIIEEEYFMNLEKKYKEKK